MPPKTRFNPQEIEALRGYIAHDEAEGYHDMNYDEIAGILLEGIRIPTTLNGLIRDYAMSAVSPKGPGISNTWTYDNPGDDETEPGTYRSAHAAAIAWLRAILDVESRKTTPSD